MKSNIFKYGIIAAIGIVLSYLDRNIHIDDALIYYRYIENFINGSGLVYNAGEKFNALTSPLYLYISILFTLIFRDVESVQIILNCIFIILSGFLIYRLFSSLGYESAGFISALLFISSKYFYLVFGLETNLFVLLSLLVIYLYFTGNFKLIPYSAGLLLLTRGEGLFLLLIIGFLLNRYDRDKINYKFILVPAVFISANIIFNWIYYGSIIPHTLSVKIGQGSSGLWGKYSFLFGSFHLFGMFNNQAYLILFFSAAALAGLIKFYKLKPLSILLTYTAALTIFYLALNIPSYHWYYSVHFLSYYVLTGFGISMALEKIYSLKFNTVAKTAIAALFLAYPALTQIEISRQLVKEGPHSQYKLIGGWLMANTRNDTKIAAAEIGHLGWYSKRYIIDILGLTNKENGNFIASGEFKKWYEVYKPDFIVAHQPVWPQEVIVTDLLANGEYIPVEIDGIKDYTVLRSKNYK